MEGVGAAGVPGFQQGGVVMQAPDGLDLQRLMRAARHGPSCREGRTLQKSPQPHLSPVSEFPAEGSRAAAVATAVVPGKRPENTESQSVSDCF